MSFCVTEYVCFRFRAVELGLTTEDLKATEELASSQEPAIRSVHVKELHADASVVSCSKVVYDLTVSV